MKTKTLFTLVVALIMAVSLLTSAWANKVQDTDA
jgi:hypothetical protein